MCKMQDGICTCFGIVTKHMKFLRIGLLLLGGLGGRYVTCLRGVPGMKFIACFCSEITCFLFFLCYRDSP